MSLIGKKTAVVGLGLACQTVFQIHEHAELLSEALGDDLVRSRLPFDWTLVPAAKATAWLKSGKAFPSSPDELIPVEGTPGAYLWPETGIHFWHDFRTPDGIDMIGTFDDTRDMYERHFRKLRGLGELDQVIAVVANTQNNADTILPRADLLYRGDHLADLKAAFETVIGRPSRMLCLAYLDRRGRGLISDPARDITVTWLPHDKTAWHGHRGLWRNAFLKYFKGS